MADADGRNITQQGAGVTGIKDRGEQGTWRKGSTTTSLQQPIVKSLEGKISISMLQRVEGQKRRTLSLILSPLAATSTSTTERSVHK